MTYFLLSPKLKEIIEESKLGTNQKAKLLSKSYINHENLITFYSDYKPTESLIELTRTAKLYIPNKNESNESKPKSEEFLKSMDQLRLRAKEEEYQKLINPNPNYQTLYETNINDTISPAQAHKELKNQMTTIVNIMISVGSVVYAVWYWTETSWKLQDSYRVLLCLFFGLLVLIAEVVVYMGYLNRIEEAKMREIKKKEVKKLIKTLDLNKLE